MKQQHHFQTTRTFLWGSSITTVCDQGFLRPISFDHLKPFPAEKSRNCMIVVFAKIGGPYYSPIHCRLKLLLNVVCLKQRAEPFNFDSSQSSLTSYCPHNSTFLHNSKCWMFNWWNTSSTIFRENNIHCQHPTFLHYALEAVESTRFPPFLLTIKQNMAVITIRTIRYHIKMQYFEENSQLSSEGFCMQTSEPISASFGLNVICCFHMSYISTEVVYTMNSDSFYSDVASDKIYPCSNPQNISRKCLMERLSSTNKKCSPLF